MNKVIIIEKDDLGKYIGLCLSKTSYGRRESSIEKVIDGIELLDKNNTIDWEEFDITHFKDYLKVYGGYLVLFN